MAVQSFGKYTIVRRLGSGGMAEVNLARDPMLDRNVAIKVIHPYLVSDVEFDERFRREARMVASLRHPNVVQVFEFDVFNGAPFMAMEYLDGGTLKDRLAEYRARGETMPLQEASTLLTAIASALTYAHERGLVHRDLKPANILFTSHGDPVITDFGIAKILGDPSQMTMSGKLLGTPAYMSPEQATSKPVDSRSDIYSLGVILYEMTAGTVPFKGESTTAVMMQHLTEPPPRPQQFNPKLTEPVQAVILKALAKNADDRYPTARAMASAFEAALSGRPADQASTEIKPVNPNDSTIDEESAQTLIRAGAATPAVELGLRTLQSPKRTDPVRPAIGPGEARPSSTGTPTRRLGTKGILGAAVVLALLLVAVVFGVAKLGTSGQASPLVSGIAPTVVVVSASPTSAPTALAALTSPSAATSMPGMPGMASSAATTAPNVGGAVQEVGLLRFGDAAATSDQVTVSLTNIVPPAAGHRYEAWLVGKDGEARVSLGKLDLDKNGSAQLSYVDKDGQNLLGQFDRFELTLQPDPDPSTLPSGIVMYSSGIPPGALMHIRHLLVAFTDTPKNIGLDVGLLKDAKLVYSTTRDVLDANQKGDFERLLIDAETLVNVIEGKQGQHYGDLDHNGIVSDTSDGYGLLLNGKSQGYIEGITDHASLAAASPDATAEIRAHSEHVKIAAKDLEGWATQLRDLGLQIVASKNAAAANEAARNAASVGDRFLNGIDLDGDEKVDPVPGEAGAQTAYQHAFYMADMPILSGPNAMPTPGPK